MLIHFRTPLTNRWANWLIISIRLTCFYLIIFMYSIFVDLLKSCAPPNFFKSPTICLFSPSAYTTKQNNKTIINKHNRIQTRNLVVHTKAQDSSIGTLQQNSGCSVSRQAGHHFPCDLDIDGRSFGMETLVRHDNIRWFTAHFAKQCTIDIIYSFLRLSYSCNINVTEG